MPRIIRTVVSPEGNIHADFSGFVGDECAAEEERMRRDLAELGLVVEVTAMQEKAAEAGRSLPVRHQVGQ